MNNGHKPGGSLSSLLIGAAIGAAAITMLHEPTRRRMKNKLRMALDESEKKMDQLKDQAESVKKDIKNRAVRELNKTQRRLAANA